MKKNTAWLFLFVFLFGCAATVQKQANIQEVSESASVPPIQMKEFIIGPGDVLQTQVWRHTEFNASVKVQPNGLVSFPLIGDINVKDMGVYQFRDLYAQKLDKYIVDPQVSIQIAMAVYNKIYILGEVRRPGIFVLDEPKTISEAIVFAGGFTYSANESKVVLMRKGADGSTKPVEFDVDAIMNGTEPHNDIYLQRGDIVYVPLSNIALVDRFFNHLNLAISSIIGGQSAIINYPAVESVTSGDYKDVKQSDQNIIIVQP
jgi:polysaccharide export outer membrane protein